MIRQCDDNDYELLMQYLKQEPVYHTFMIADIETYGFDKEFQTVYVQESDSGCSGIFLKYYQNFIVAGKEEEIDWKAVVPLLTDEITTVMGRAELVRRIDREWDRKHVYEQKELFVLEDRAWDKAGSQVRTAGLEDVDRIYEFLMGIPQLKPLYFRKDMIENRIRSGEGNHVVIEKEGRVIAHGNSAASTDQTVMLGGIGVSPSHRRLGYASQIMEHLCAQIQKENRIPCIFASGTDICALCAKLGFVRYGFWGTAQAEEQI